MTKEETIKKLTLEINLIKKSLASAEQALENFKSLPENNVFDSLEDAEDTLEELLSSKAREDCEGSYCCGAEEYEQEFICQGEHYMATLSVEYNRLEKTYYYVDNTEFKVKKL